MFLQLHAAELAHAKFTSGSPLSAGVFQVICHHYAGYLRSTVVRALGSVELAHVQMALRKTQQEERKRLIKFYWFAVWLCSRQMVTRVMGRIGAMNLISSFSFTYLIDWLILFNWVEEATL